MAATFTVQSGKKYQPERILCYGTAGCGKSTFASKAPNPIFLDIEHGSPHLAVDRVPDIDTWDKLLGAVRWLETEKHDYQTVVLDTLDRAEWMCWHEMFKTGGKNGAAVDTIADVGGGYGAGYTAAYEDFRRLWGALEHLWSRRQMRVIVLAHSKTERVGNVRGPDYQRYTLKVHKEVAGMVFEACDIAAFAEFEIGVKKVKDEIIVTGGENRIMHLVQQPEFLAKNRQGIVGDLPLSWDDFAIAIAETHMPDTLIATILDRAKRHAPGRFAGVDSAVTKAKRDPEQLAKILQQLNSVLAKEAGAIQEAPMVGASTEAS